MVESGIDSKDALARYASGPASLRDAVAGLSDDALDASPDAGGWSIRQIVHHVADGDDIWKTCIKMALAGGARQFQLEWYWSIPQDVWAETWAYDRLPIEPALSLLSANRAQIVGLLELAPNGRDRQFKISWPGSEEASLSVDYVLEMQADHVAQHVEDIRRIRGAGAE